MAAAAIATIGSDRARRRAVVFVLSILLHGLVLGWFAFRQDGAPDEAGVPAVEIQLLDVAKLPRPPKPAPSDTDVVQSPVTRPVLPIAPRYVGPPAASGGGQRGVDLFGPVFADGEWPRPRTLRDCDPVTDPGLTSPACQHELEIARSVTRAHDPREGTDDFARSARQNEAVRRYHEASGTAGFQGIGCHVLGRC